MEKKLLEIPENFVAGRRPDFNSHHACGTETFRLQEKANDHPNSKSKGGNATGSLQEKKGKKNLSCLPDTRESTYEEGNKSNLGKEIMFSHSFLDIEGYLFLKEIQDGSTFIFCF